MDNVKAQQHQRSVEEYLRSIENLYFLDQTSGIYRQHVEESSTRLSCECFRNDEQRPFWVATHRDWLALFLGILTLIGLALTVAYTRRQWLVGNAAAAYANDAAHSTQFAAEVSRDALNELRISGAASTKQFATQIAKVDASLKEASKQSEAMERLVTSAKESAEVARTAMYAEQRPWVGVEIMALRTDPIIRTDDGIGAVGFGIVARNSGRTPAVRLHVECCMRQTTEREMPVPNYDELLANPDSQFSAGMKTRVSSGEESVEQARASVRETQRMMDRSSDSEVVAPGVTTKLPDPTVETHSDDHLYHYTLGKLVYRDVLDPSKAHVSQYCIVSFGNSAQFHLCRTGNDME